MLFHACPLLHQWSHDHEQAFNTFMQYKTRVPVCGAIMLNDTWEKVGPYNRTKIMAELRELSAFW
jgi:mRNA-decapping enzyme subunit 2